MGLINKLDLIVFVGTALDNGPDCKNMRDQILFIAIRVDTLLVLLLDFSSQLECLLNDIFPRKLSPTILLILVNTLVISLFISIVPFFQQVFSLGIVRNLLNVLEQIVDILGLSEFLENSLLISLEHFLFVLYHLSVLVVVVAQNVVDLLYCQCPVHSLYVLQLACYKIVFVHYLLYEVVC